MRVDLSNPAAGPISNDPSSQALGTQNARNASAPALEEDRTTLTSDPGSVSALVSTAMSSPEIREDKVASLQQAIASGQYDLDPAKTAASMLDEQA